MQSVLHQGLGYYWAVLVGLVLFMGLIKLMSNKLRMCVCAYAYYICVCVCVCVCVCEPLSLQVKREGIVGLVPGNYVELVSGNHVN